MKYYINGKYVKENDAKISIHDMGFAYGYGIFETMRFDKKKYFHIPIILIDYIMD